MPTIRLQDREDKNKKIPQSKMIEVGFYSVSISIFSI